VNHKVLIIDDEKNVAFVIAAILEKAGFTTHTLTDSRQAEQVITSEPICAIITDLYMPNLTGFEVLALIQRLHPGIPLIMITAFGTVEAAVNALKRGAFDFVTKPFDQAELLDVVQKATTTFFERQKEPVYLGFPLQTLGIPVTEAPLPGIMQGSIIGSSPQMVEIFRVIQKISGSPSTVLIRGESGTGKELVALEIHKNSGRQQKPFIKINCAAIPTTLIESELFGHEKGAFTGAVAAKPGKFELANEGTLFLDEVAEMSLEMQAKLLRVLQEHEFERVGAVTTTKVDTRIITATNKDLEAEVKSGRFREDLFYRLNVVPITMPALRERVADIDLLCAHFVNRFNEKLHKNIEGISRSTLEAFHRYLWPGNIRQLENVLERMMLMTESTILNHQDLPEEIKSTFPLSDVSGMENKESDLLSFKELVKRQTQAFERDLIEKALDDTNGNVTKTAEKLGLSRKGLQLKMKELGIRRSTTELLKTP
jgi:DNA-binding NtrC family response regulator